MTGLVRIDKNMLPFRYFWLDAVSCILVHLNVLTLREKIKKRKKENSE